MTQRDTNQAARATSCWPPGHPVFPPRPEGRGSQKGVWWLSWFTLSVLLPQVVWAACTTANMAVAGAGNVPPRYFRCAQYADRPTAGLNAGDTLYVSATGASYRAATSTTWVSDTAGPVYHVKAYGALCDGTTDDSTAVTNAIAAANSAGTGGIIEFPPGTCVINSQIALPNDGGSPAKQLPFRLHGAMSAKAGQQNAPYGGTRLLLGYSGSGAKIVTTARGVLELDHLSLEESGATTTTPFLLTNFTILSVDANKFYRYSSKALTTCDQDAILLGTSSTGMGGYGTVIERNQFDRIRRAVWLQSGGGYGANASVIQQNDVRANAGSNVTTAVTAATNASTAVLTVVGHGFRIGTTLSMTLSGFTGSWVPLNATLVAHFLTVDTFEVYTAYPGSPVNSTTFGALTGTPVFFSGAAFDLVGQTGGGMLASGNVFANNLVEMMGYAYGFQATQGQNNLFTGNGFYDAVAGTALAGYRFDSTATNNTVIQGRRTGGLSGQMVIDLSSPTTTTIIDGTAGGSYSFPNAITSNLLINQNLTGAPTPLVGTMLQLVGVDTVPTAFEMYAFTSVPASGPKVTLSRAEGTNAQLAA